jgi:hypothetical protein
MEDQPTWLRGPTASASGESVSGESKERSFFIHIIKSVNIHLKSNSAGKLQLGKSICVYKGPGTSRKACRQSSIDNIARNPK